MFDRFTLVLLLGVLAPGVVEGATAYYVAKTGSDSNNGRQTSPFLTIQKAAGVVKPGDTVSIGPGTYSEYPLLSTSGSAVAPITFVGAPGYATMVSGFKLRANYTVLSNLNMTWGAGTGAYLLDMNGVPCNNNSILNCSFHLLGQPAGVWAAGNGNLLQGCTLEGGGDPSGPPAQYLLFSGNSNLITRNRVTNGDDIDFIKVFGTHNAITCNDISGLDNQHYLTSEHTDFVQMFQSGSFVTVASNYVHDCPNCDIGNTEYDITGPGTGSSAATHDLYIFDNVFANVSNPLFSGISNTFIYNNVFYRVGYSIYDGPVYFYQDASTRTSVGSRVFNNVFLLCGSAPSNNWIGTMVSQGATLANLNISFNYFGGAGFASKNITNGAYIGSNAVNGGDPQVANIEASDFHLLAGSPLSQSGTNLYPNYPTDLDGFARPASGNWAIGPYEPGSVDMKSATNPPPSVSVISRNAMDIDPSVPGVQVYEGTTDQYSCTVTNPTGNAISWQWLYAINGGTPTIALSGTGFPSALSFNFPTGTGGNVYVFTMVTTDSVTQLSAQAQCTTVVEALPAALSSLTFQAGSGTVTAPLVLSSGAVSQPVQTSSLATAGRAAYSFVLTNAGNYVIQALVNAPNSGGNSFYVGVDAVPVDPIMIWDIGQTANFEQRIVGWRGSGAAASNQFVPKVFALTPGVHQIIFAGREGGVQLQSFAIHQVPSGVQNLRILPTFSSTNTFGVGP